ncbi:MAG TPA: FHA domain-containing protein [Gemmatimonadaceae bacterium]|nr:FHA domain-containing protein [Gemmatimonadaceae bacterium]
MPYLEFQEQRRALGPGVLTIGSGTEAGWRIVDQDLAPLHALVTLERAGQAMLASGDPDAPVFINDAELLERRVVLRFGDRIRLGRAEFTYVQTAQKVRPDERYLRDTRRGRVYRLSPITRIGRDPRCTVLIQEPDVSRIHAEIALENGKFLLSAVGAAYVLLNHDRIHGPTELREGDEVSIGRTVLTFSAETGTYRVADTSADAPQLGVDRRAGKMQTMYMGAIEARENIRRREHRRVVAIIAVVVVVFVMIWLGILRW